MLLLKSIYYYDHAGGKLGKPPILLIHGAGGSHMGWPVEFRRLRGWRVISIDLPGHGKSSAHCLQSVQDYSQRIHKFVMEMGFYHFIPLGCSLGGAIALQLCVDHPDQVSALGLVACADHFTIPHELMDVLSLPRYYQDALTLFEQLCFTTSTPRKLRWQIMQPLSKQRSSLLYNDLLACAKINFSSILKQVQCPTWLACGEEDELVPVTDARIMARQIKKCHLDAFNNCGHMLLTEQPEMALERLLNFLGTLPE